jgi:hypothetical protein
MFTFLAKHHVTQVCQPLLQPRFGSLRLLASLKAKITNEREGICECDAYIKHKLSQRRVTADWLAPRKSDCSRMGSKVSSDWLPSYIKVTRPFLEIFKTDGYTPDSPRMIQSDDNPVWWLDYSWVDSVQGKYIFLLSTLPRTPLQGVWGCFARVRRNALWERRRDTFACLSPSPVYIRHVILNKHRNNLSSTCWVLA